MDNGLPVTRVISRVLLQEKLAEAARRYGGDKIIQNDCHVVDFEEVLCRRGLYKLLPKSRPVSRVIPESMIACWGVSDRIIGLCVGSQQSSAVELVLLLVAQRAMQLEPLCRLSRDMPRRRWISRRARNLLLPFWRTVGASRATS